MYQYAHVSVESRGLLFYLFEEHQEIIDQYAAKGYRFVTWIPTHISSHGAVKTMDLYFEKEVQETEENK